MMDIQHLEDNLIVITASGTLTIDDYETLAPTLEQEADRHDALRLVSEVHDFGWEPGAALEDLKLDLKLNREVTKLATIGDAKWQDWLTQLTKPFAAGELRYFDESDRAAAYAWIRQ